MYKFGDCWCYLLGEGGQFPFAFWRRSLYQLKHIIKINYVLGFFPQQQLLFTHEKKMIGLWCLYHNFDGLVHNCSISTANTLDMLQSCTNPSIFEHRKFQPFPRYTSVSLPCWRAPVDHDTPEHMPRQHPTLADWSPYSQHPQLLPGGGETNKNECKYATL